MRENNIIKCDGCKKPVDKDDSPLIEGACYGALCLECGEKQTKEKRKRTFELTQELRQIVIDNRDQKISFACYECACDNGTMVFDSETRTPLLRISNDNKMSVEEIYNELVKKRNKLNRQISTLKKANQKETNLVQAIPGEKEFINWVTN